MTKIVTMQDPRGVSGRDITVVDSGQQAVDLIYKFMPHFNCDESVAYINNVKLNMPTFEGDEVIDRGDEHELTRPLTDDDVLIIVNEPKGVFVTAFLIAAAVAAAVAYFMVPDVPGNEAKVSSNNDLYGQRNVARVYEAIPDIYGNIISYPDLITAEASKYYEGNQPNIRQIMCVGVGYYDIPVGEMKLGGTPVTQIPGASVTIHEPDEDGITTIPNYEHHTSVNEVDGQELVGLGDTGSGLSGAEVNYDSTTDVVTITDSEASYTEVLSSGDQGRLAISDLDDLDATHVLDTVTASQLVIENASTYSPKWAERDPASYPFTVTNGVFARDDLPSFIGPFDTKAKGDAIILDIKYTRGLVGNDVPIRVQYAEIDEPGGSLTGIAGFVDVTHSPITTKPEEFDDALDYFKFLAKKTYDAQDRSIFIDLTGIGGDKKYFRVSVARLNKTSDDTENPDLAKWARLASVVREPEKKLANVTIAELNLPGTQAALSPRDNNLNMSVTRKTVTYDSVTGEVVETLAPSKKFADAILHEHYVTFGRPLDEIDLDELYEIQENIDAENPLLGEFSFTFDDIDVSLGERIEAMCAVARVRTYRDGTVWRFTRDEAKDINSGLITRKDIAAEREYSRTWKPRLPSEHDSVRVEFVDPDTNKKAYVYRSFKNEEIAVTAGANPLEIKLAGCRNRTQAENRANLEIRRLIYDGWILTDTLLIQGNMYDLGQVVLYSDVYADNVADGEILNFDGVDTVVLSEKILLENSGGIMFTGEFGEVYGPFAVRRVTNGNQLVETDTFEFLPNADFDNVKSNIIISSGVSRQLGSRFILTVEVSKEPERFVVSGKEPRSDGTVQLTFTEYDERLYIEGPSGSGEVGNPGGGISFSPSIFPAEKEPEESSWVNVDNSHFGFNSSNQHNVPFAHMTNDGSKMLAANVQGQLVTGGSVIQNDLVTLSSNPTDTTVTGGSASGDGEKIIIAFNDGGVIKSDDRGVNWVNLPTRLGTSGANTTLSIVVISNEGDVAYGFFDDGYWAKSEDGGDTWVEMPRLITSSGSISAPTAAFCSGNGNVVAVSYRHDEVSDSDGGTVFIIDGENAPIERIAWGLGTTKAKVTGVSYNGEIIYGIGYSSSGGSDFGRFVKSTDRGNSFSTQYINAENFTGDNNTIASSPSGDIVLGCFEPGRVLLSGPNVTDGEITYIDGERNGPNEFGDFDFAFAITNGSKWVIMTKDGEVSISQ
jgi:hypothetical protein